MPTAALAADTSRAMAIFQALSDEVRLEIIRLLGNGELCVCEITEALDIAQSRLSFHLRVLKDAELITDRRQGRWIYYTLARTAFDEAEAALKELRPAKRRLPSIQTACCD